MDSVLYLGVDGRLWRINADLSVEQLSSEPPVSAELMLADAQRDLLQAIAAQWQDFSSLNFIDQSGQALAASAELKQVELEILNVVERELAAYEQLANDESKDSELKTSEVETSPATPTPSHHRSSQQTAQLNSSYQSEGGLAQFFSTIHRNNDEMLAKTHYQTRPAPPIDHNKSEEHHQLVGKLDPDASIEVEILDGGDGWINRFEIPVVTVVGTTHKAGQQRTVELLFTDSQGQQLLFSTALLDDGSYRLEDIDLSSLAEGPVIVEASISDPYGNRISAQDDSTIDTLADGDLVAVDTGDDQLIEHSEALSAPFSGHFNYVEAGAEVALVVEDVDGKKLSFSSSVDADGRWQLNADISSLADGVLHFSASTIDQAGNPASISNSTNLLQAPQLSIEAHDNDGIYNQYESPAPLFSGTSLNIENGQPLTLVVTDLNGLSVEIHTTVNNNRWQVTGPDLSSLADGPLHIEARSSNLQGQSAQAAIDQQLDQTAELSVQFDDNDGVLNAEEAKAVLLSGTSLDIDSGEQVSLSFSDQSGASVDFNNAASINDNSWSVHGLDLSNFAPGQLQLIARAEDKPGNKASAIATIKYDPLAEIDITSVPEGPVINAAEVQAFSVLGRVVDIESGQQLAVTISDSEGNKVSGTVIVQDDLSWRFAESLDSLADGELIIDVSGDDKAGNHAEDQLNITKDTLAELSIVFDGDQHYSADELSAVSLSGRVNGIENGQVVQVKVWDSANPANELNFNAEVIDGAWQSDALDLQAAGFIDGELYASAQASDLAGNPATASTEASIDTQVWIDIDADAINISDLIFQQETVISGTSTAEADQVVKLSFSDGSNSESFSGLVRADGSWSVGVVAVTTLNRAVGWELVAEVMDRAGNTADDSTPSIVMPEPIAISEQGIIFPPVLATATSKLNILHADEFRLSADQSALDGITSNGYATTHVLSGDGLSLRMTRADGSDSLVLEAVLDPDKESLKVTLFEGVDQDVLSETLLAQIWIDATQHDADGTSETVSAPVVLAIKDVQPFLLDDHASVKETESHSGNVFFNDSSLEGPLTLTAIQVGSSIINVSATSPAQHSFAEGDLTVNYDGSWFFQANEDLDNSVSDPLVQIEYFARDPDGDVDSAQLSIRIKDGDGGHIDDEHVLYREVHVDQGHMSNRVVSVLAGSDVLEPSSVRFDNSDNQLINKLNALALSSDGEAVVFSLNADADTLTAQTAGGSAVVFIASLSALQAANGRDLDLTMVLDVRRPLDHNSSDSLLLEASIVAFDVDNATPSNDASIQLLFNDGDLPQLSLLSGASLDEDLLVAGNPALPVSSNGTVELKVGSDYIEDWQFEASAAPQLSSGGTALLSYLSADGKVLTYYLPNDADANDQSNEVLKITLLALPSRDSDSNLIYQAQMFQAIDELENGVNDGDLEIFLPVLVFDSDGDQARNNISVTMIDGDAANVGTASLTVTELPPQLGVNLDNKASANIALTASQDKLVDIGYQLTSGDAVVDAAGNAVTRNGEALHWRDNLDGSLDAIDGRGVAVFTVTLPAEIDIEPGANSDVEISLLLHSTVDNDRTNTTQVLSVKLPVAVTDSDGTKTTQQVELNIVDGRDPNIISDDNLAVDELTLQTADFDSDKGIARSSGSSDDKVSATPSLLSSITSGGEAVSMAGAADADSWWIASTSSGNEVLRLRFDLDNGNYQVQFSQAIDHDPGAGRNIKNIDFSVAVLDADNDSTTATFTVAVSDDIPVAQNIVQDLVEGKTVSGSLMPDNSAGADGGSITQMSYGGKNYSANADGKFVIELKDDADQEYATLTVSADGSYKLVSRDAFNLSDVHTDIIDYQVTDNDGDIENGNVFTVNVKDASGNIIFPPLLSAEDQPLDISALVINPGDADQNETVTKVVFDTAKLAGGSLTLNGVALAIDGDGNAFLTQDQLINVVSGTDPGSVGPNGTLLYHPALNQSQATSSPQLDIRATVSSDVGDKTIHGKHGIKITSVADEPLWDDSSQFIYTLDEDDGGSAVQLSASLFDTDGSEKLNYRIDSIDSGLELKRGPHVVKVGEHLSVEQLAQLHVAGKANVAGSFNFVIAAVATEQDNKDSAESSRTVTVQIAPVADQPSLVVTPNKRSLEDVDINLKTLVSGKLGDSDGSERLGFELTVPDGWSVVGLNGAVVSSAGLVFSFWDDDLQAGNIVLRPLEDISSVSGDFNISVQAVAHESTQGGVAPEPGHGDALSAAKNLHVDLKGVVDEPDYGPGPDGLWSYDDGSKTISAVQPFDEDGEIKLNFDVGTEDEDGSEHINLLIAGLPEGVELVDGDGKPAKLAIVGFIPGFDGNNAIYQVQASELANLSLKPPQDFSGELNIRLEQINTEPDGDSASFDVNLHIVVNPVIDSDGNLTTQSQGIEDQPVVLNFSPELGDVDGSETVADVVIPANAGSLQLDGKALPAGQTRLSDLLDATSPSMAELLSSNRVTWLPPQDAAGEFVLPVTWTIVDRSETGVEQSRDIDGQLKVHVDAQVEIDTIIDGGDDVLVSSDGSPIALDNSAGFWDSDLDGSEILDYIQLTMPEADGWSVTHPNGAIHDGRGNWLIPATGFSSDTVAEAGVQLLQGATISSDHSTSSALGYDLIKVSARVIDDGDRDRSNGYDAEMRNAAIKIRFDQPGDSDGAGELYDVQTSVIDGREDEFFTSTGHLDGKITDDSNDNISFRIDTADMPRGGWISGPDVRAQYDASGKHVIAFVFTDASINHLHFDGLEQDFAGVMQMPMTVIATDPSGDTRTDIQTLQFEIGPIVDTASAPTVGSSLEDEAVVFDFDLSALVGDVNTQPNEGVESVIALRFSLPADGGQLNDPEGVLVADGMGNYVLNDTSKLSSLSYTPPLNYSGNLSLPISLQVQDATVPLPATGQDNVVSDWFDTALVFDIQPVTDHAIVNSADVRGAEDSDISLTGLSAELFDVDGSEVMSLQIKGVPKDAVIFWNSGASLQQLPNNGADGGSFQGQPTSAFSVLASQLDNLVLRPPLDFSGDLPLSLEAITVETATGESLSSDAPFMVYIDPVADQPQMANDLSELNANEGDVINIAIKASTTETVNANESLKLQVHIDAAASDASALDGLTGIKIGDKQASFIRNPISGDLIASLDSASATIDSFELISGATAFGDLHLSVGVVALDTAVVDGKRESDRSDAVTQDLVIHLNAEPDAPLLTLSYDNLYSDADANSTQPLGLSLSAQNPAPGEKASLLIEGAPEHISFIGATRSGANWLLAEDKVADVQIVGLKAGDNFSLVLTPQSTLDGKTVSGTTASMEIEVGSGGDSTLSGSGLRDRIVGGAGDDVVSGAAGEDFFVFEAAGAGAAGSPAADQISDFSVGEDHIDLSDLLSSVDSSSGSELDSYVDLSDNGSDSTLVINLGGGAVQQILISSQTVDDLYGGNTDGLDDAAIFQKLIDDQVLITS